MVVTAGVTRPECSRPRNVIGELRDEGTRQVHAGVIQDVVTLTGLVSATRAARRLAHAARRVMDALDRWKEWPPRNCHHFMALGQ